MAQSDRQPTPLDPPAAAERVASPGRRPYEAPRVLTDEAFEQISLACTAKMTTHKTFT